MNCPKCNSVVSKRDTKCPVCGANLPVAQPAVPQQRTSTPTQTPSARPQQAPSARVNTTPSNNYVNQKPRAASYRPTPAQRTTTTVQRNGAGSYVPANNTGDKSSFFLNLVSFMMPFVGFIFYFLRKTTEPIKAKAALKWSLISLALNVIVSVIFTFSSAGSF